MIAKPPPQLMVHAVLFLMLVATGAANAAESKPIPLRNTEPQFQEFIASLRTAAQSKDASAVHGVLASDYYISRDFGGSFDPSAPPIQNFSVNFQFDNAKLRPEYQDHGWVEFRRAISGKTFEKKADGQLCTPHGAQDRKPFPHSQLCFRKHDAGWRIQGHINGGD